MKITASILFATLATISSAAEETKTTYPTTIDLNGQSYRQVVVDREAGQYLGHPTTCLLEDGKKRIIMWSGLYPARLAVSDNDGRPVVHQFLLYLAALETRRPAV